MKYIKKFENINEYNVDDYIGYKRYLGLPPIIVKILSIRNGGCRSKEYFVELVESPHTTYSVNKWELEELTDEQIEELKAYLNAEKYNL